MRIVAFAATGLLLMSAAGCSKKAPAESSESASTPAASTHAPKKAAAGEDGAYDPNSAAAQAGVTPAGGKGAAAEGGGPDWDAVVAEILQLRKFPVRNSDQTQRLNSLEDDLVRAVGTDSKAREAHQNLSRLINGR